MSGSAGRAKELEDQILARLLAQLDRGQEPDVDAVRREFAESPEAVAAMVRVLARFRELLQALRQGEHPPLLCVGERVDDFEIESFLARGAVGEVYRARQVSLQGRRVALKVVRVPREALGTLARFQREAALAARIHHPHLVQIYGSGAKEERGLLYYAMRLVEGPTLRAALDALSSAACREEATVRACVARVAEVASALARLHAEGLVHRDVKPTNIMLDGGGLGDGSATLVDYGLLRPIEVEPTRSSVRLTVHFAAPEQLQGRAADPRSDVFALGAVLHDALTGRRSDERGPAAEGLEPLRSLAPWIDADLEAVVLKATQLEPDWRYGDAAAFDRDLRSWLAGTPVAARRPGSLRRAARWMAAHPARSLRIVAWVGVLLAIGALLMLGAVLSYRVTVGAERARRAWEEGRFSELVPELEALPSLGRSLLTSELAKLSSELERDDADPTVSVVRLAAHSRAEAVRLAASHLQGEGLASRPELGRFLLSELRARPRATVPDLARLFFERADGSPAEVSASAALREVLLDLLRSSPDVEVARSCLTALSGCATPAEALPIAAWSRARAEQLHESGQEEVRLVACVLAEVLYWRAPGCGFLLAIDGALLDGCLEECSRGIELLGPTGPKSDAAAATLVLFRVFEITRRLAGLPVGTCVPTWDCPAMELRAVRHDPELRADLGAGLEAFLAQRHVKDPYEFGRLVGYFEDPVLTAALQPGDEGPQGVSWSPRDAGVLYSSGLACAEADLRAEGPQRLPDPDTLMSAALAAKEEPWRTVESQPLREAKPPRVAYLDFEEVPTRVDGRGIRILTRGVRLLGQELSPGRGFARLGVAGVSALRVEFDVPANARLEAVEVYAQKGIRWLLPRLGTARLDVLCDGQVLVENLGIVSGTHERLRLPLIRPESPQARRLSLELRLSAASDTTLRILRIELLGREQDPSLDGGRR